MVETTWDINPHPDEPQIPYINYSDRYSNHKYS